MADIGIKISKSGYGVDDTDPRNFVLHSAYSAFKIISKGQVAFNVVIGNTSVTVTVAHGQSIIPAFWCHFELEDGEAWQHYHARGFIAPTAYNPQDPDGKSLGCNSFIDATNLNMMIRISSPATSAYTLYGYYYILADPTT